MPVLTLRGFPTWILGINPGEVEEDPTQPGKAEQIRQMILAYQVEAVDVLYRHFAQKAQVRPALTAPTAATVIPAEPTKPAPEATRAERIAYYEDLEVWARWKANQEAQEWRGEVEEWRGEVSAALEGDRAIIGIIPELIERLGPETISATHQGQVKGYVKRLHELTKKPFPTIYEDIRLAFGPASYRDLLESEWSQIEVWFLREIEKAKRLK